ncbi:MAG: ketoacyl-ACP synthase III [Candidatus Eisenbacteria sp.]|nr:ketoacyl-ACP synthase III [Candidatus Eisenbacteria bacterium]
MITRSRVFGTGMAVPDHIITNEYLSTIVDTSDEWIRTRTGMKERRQVRPDQAASDLAIPASQQALEEAGLSPQDLDMIIVATISPDTLFPSTACIIQDKIGARQIPAFDISAGCTGAIYAHTLADQLIRTGHSKYILIIGVELLTKITNWSDRSTCVLFGDGAGASVVGPSENGSSGLLGHHIASDGKGASMLYIPAGGSRMPASRETVDKNLHVLFMKGNEIYKTAISTMSESCHILLKQEGLTPQDVDLFVFHQANLRILEAVGKRLRVSPDRVFVNIHKYGNTSTATTMMAVHEAVQEGKIQRGSLVLQVAFGAGLTWGGLLWRW